MSSWQQKKKEVPSTNNFRFDARLSNKSVMYMKKSRGPRKKPCEILAPTFVHGEFWPFNTTLCFLLFKKSVTVLKRLPDIPFCFSLKGSPSCQTLSNALEISRKTFLVTP